MKMTKALYPLFLILLAFTVHLSANQNSHHPIFTKFPEVQIPEFSEEYFEWIDLLEAIDEADSSFTMVEVGAGYGRWSANGALAARSINMPFYLALIEAEPYRTHVAIPEYMQKYSIPNSQYKIFDTSVGPDTNYTFFYLSKGEWTLETWYGQCIILPYDHVTKWTNEKYYGHPIVNTDLGYTAVAVNQRLFSDILNEIEAPIIDLCDFDIQGTEFEVIKEAINVLNSRVKRLHIGTHSHTISKKLRLLLETNGWEIIRDYLCLQVNKTEYGSLKFVDGVQSWRNKRFK